MPDRIILIDKPFKWTSFDVVNKLRKPLLLERKRELPDREASQLKHMKVGHAGTLDPLATGLLVICSGKFTTGISNIQDSEKEYTGKITLGSTTASYDLETVPENFLAFDHLTEERIFEIAKSFTGKQQQIPPAHSAKKIDGVRAYERARAGEAFEMKPNEITVYSFEIENISLPEITFRIVCSKGTYIRSIAHDFGKKANCGGHLSELCRTRIGSYKLKNATSPKEFLLQLTQLQNIKSENSL